MNDNIDRYDFHVAYSEEDKAYIGTVTEFPYLSADGQTPEQAHLNIKSLVKDAIEIMGDYIDL